MIRGFFWTDPIGIAGALEIYCSVARRLSCDADLARNVTSDLGK